jgi:hypothetical protein
MGAGSSSHDIRIEKQEAFVRQNLKQFKDNLNSGKDRRNSYQMIYSDDQVRGKLRQLYHNSDTVRGNNRTYINPQEWQKAKSTLRY